MLQDGPSNIVKSAPGIFFLKIPTDHAWPVTEGTLVSSGLKEMSPEAEEMLLGCLTTGSSCYVACSLGQEAGGSHMLASSLQEEAPVHSAIWVMWLCVCLCPSVCA